nr:hypothetical protein [Bartonella washoeensis]
MRLEKKARLIIRASGTEPVIRVMAEGDDREALDAVVTEMVDEKSALSSMKRKHFGGDRMVNTYPIYVLKAFFFILFPQKITHKSNNWNAQFSKRQMFAEQ